MAVGKTLRTAVIGYGPSFDMGKNHAAWMNGAGMDTIAACDIDPARLEAAQKDYPGIRVYPSVKQLLKDKDVELCVVILPHNQHGEVAVQCLNAGKHVISEKPMCITVAEADAMIEAARKNKVTLTIFHNRRHDGDYLAIKELIEKGVIGDVFQVEAAGGGYGHPGTWWRADKKISGGILYDWGAHFFDWILNLVPSEMTAVDGYMQKRVWTDQTNEDHALVIVRFDNGCTASLEMSSLNKAPKPRWRILGTKGAIVDEGQGHLTVNIDHDGYAATMKVPYKKGDWTAFYRNLVAHLNGERDLEVKPEESRRIIAIIEAAERSAKSGHTEPPAYA